MTVKSDTGYTEIAAALKRGLKYLEEEPESFEAASIYAALAWNYSTMDDWNEANAWTEKALKVGEKSGNLNAVSRGLAMKGSYLTDTDKIDEGLPVWRKALDLSLQQDDPFAARITLDLSVYTYPRDLAESMKLMLRFLELSRQFNVVDYEARALGFPFYLNWLKGDWATALEQLQKASEVIERLDVEVSVAVIEVLAFKGWLLLSQGNLAMSDENLQKASELTKQIPKTTLILRCYLPLGILRLEQGREEEAREIFESCVDSFKNFEYTTEPLLH